MNLTAQRLREEHRPGAIRERLRQPTGASYLGDAVLGGIDGCVTTFAIVAGAWGAGFPRPVVLILGVANLVADGFSMAVSNFLSTRSRQEEVEQKRREEEQHIDSVPEGEREEIRQIFAAKGFAEETLERIVETVTADRSLWVKTMLTEEHGLQPVGHVPWRSGLATFVAFAAVGLVPLLSFLVPGMAVGQRFIFSTVATGLAFASVGVVKGLVLNRPIWRSGFETLLMGGAAAVLAYWIGAGLRGVVDGGRAMLEASL